MRQPAQSRARGEAPPRHGKAPPGMRRASTSPRRHATVADEGVTDGQRRCPRDAVCTRPPPAARPETPAAAARVPDRVHRVTGTAKVVNSTQADLLRSQRLFASNRSSLHAVNDGRTRRRDLGKGAEGYEKDRSGARDRADARPAGLASGFGPNGNPKAVAACTSSLDNRPPRAPRGRRPRKLAFPRTTNYASLARPVERIDTATASTGRCAQ